MKEKRAPHDILDELKMPGDPGRGYSLRNRLGMISVEVDGIEGGLEATSEELDKLTAAIDALLSQYEDVPMAPYGRIDRLEILLRERRVA